MRPIATLLLLPTLLVLTPGAAASCDAGADAPAYAVAGSRAGVTMVSAHAGTAGTDVGIATCWWPERHVEVWQESNGIPGLQTGGYECAADTYLGEATLAAGRGVCYI